jgi:hypothetical protein
MTIRKNFLLDDEVVQHLKKLAQEENATQTDIVRNLIEEKYDEINKKEKLKIFNSIIPMPFGSLVDKSIQSIKAEMGANI